MFAENQKELVKEKEKERERENVLLMLYIKEKEKSYRKFAFRLRFFIHRIKFITSKLELVSTCLF